MVSRSALITARLRAPFLPDEHEEHEHFGLIYLKERAISDRLTRVLGNSGWSFSLLGKSDIVEIDNTHMVTQQGRLTLRFPSETVPGAVEETWYDNVGGDVMLSLGKTKAEKVMNTIKGATTDAYKRCARSGGVGLYLTTLPKGTNMASLPNYLAELGYIPTIRAAKTKFLTGAGYTPEMPESELNVRIDWYRDNGYDEYDMMTIMPFILNHWKEEHE